MKNNSNQLGSAIRWLAAGRLAGQVVTWGTTILVMRILRPEDYGLAAMGATLIALVGLVSEFGFGVAIVQAKNISRPQLSSIFGAALLFSICAYCTVFIISYWFSYFYGDPRLTGIIRVSGLMFILVSLETIPDALLRRSLNFRTLSLVDLSSAIFGSFITFILAFYDFGYWALIIGPLAYAGCRSTVLNIVVQERVLPSRHIGLAIDLVRFGAKVATARLAGYAVTQSDIIFAGKFLGKESLGFYTVALDLAMMPLNKIMSIVNQIALPTLSNTARDRPEKKQEELLKGLELIAYVIFPCLWGIAAIAPWIIPALLGDKWLPAITPLQIIALALPIRVISNYISTATLSFGRPDIEVKDKLTSAIIFPTCFLIGVQFGVVGLALAWCVALPVSVLINLQRTKHAFQVGTLSIATALTKPIFFSGIMALLILSGATIADKYINHWAIISLMVFFGITTYIILFLFFDKNNALIIINGIRGKK